VKLALIPFLFFLNFYSFCQNNERLWEHGKLTWEDFQSESIDFNQNDSELSYHISYSTTREKTGDTTFLKFQTKNFIIPKNSWVKENKKNDQLLKYNQVLFDIIEIYRRELQYDLNRIGNIYLADKIFSQLNEKLNAEIRLFQRQTKLGSEYSKLDEWSLKIDEELKDLELEAIPEITDKNFGIGLNIGFGTGLFSGNIRNNFTPSFNIGYGFDFAYKKFSLLLNASLASNKIKDGFSENQLTWESNLKTNTTILDASLGYTFIDNSKHKITSFAGIGVFEVAVSDNEGDNYSNHRITSTSLVYGLNYDFKFLKAIRLTPAPFFNGYKERAEHSLRVRLYFAHPTFENMRGTSFNLIVGYSLFSRIIKLD
jgi:hypothetical protein